MSESTFPVQVSRSWLLNTTMGALIALAGMALGWVMQLRELSKSSDTQEKIIAAHEGQVRTLERDVFGKEQRIRALEEEKQRTITVVCECSSRPRGGRQQ